jgi:hypothetical protein
MSQAALSNIENLWRTVMIMTVLFFPLYSASEPLTPPDSGCSKWRDSLVVAGMHSLDSGRFADARRYFAGAFKCGIRKDSMYFYISELYLRQMVLDTALVFNQAVEQAGTFPRALWTMQRAKIYWMIGRKKQADSLMTSLQAKKRHEFSLFFSGTRNTMALNKFTFIPQHLSLSPVKDTDDLGEQNIYYKYSSRSGRLQLPWYLQFTANSFLPVPTRHFLDEMTDTLFQTYGMTVGIGAVTVTPEFSVGFRFRVHADGTIDNYWNVGFTIPLAGRNLVLVGHDEKRIDNELLDDYRTNISWYRFYSYKKMMNSFNLTIAHHFGRSDIYQNRLDSSGIYRPLPKGYIDINDTTRQFYKDAYCTQPFGVIPRNDWNKQPAMYFMTAPEHDVNVSVKYVFTHMLPFTSIFNVSGYFQGVYYPEKVTWYTTDNSVLSGKSPEALFRNCAMVYDITGGKYYLSIDRTQPVYFADKLVELHYHEKTRLDAYFIVSSTFRKTFGNYGDLNCTASFTKGFSTMSENDPMVTFNYAWEFIAGWKKDITVLK